MHYQVFVQNPEAEEWNPCYNGILSPSTGTTSLAVFDNGKDAAAFRKEMAQLHKTHRYTVRKVSADEMADRLWREREAGRFASGDYVKTPFHDEAWYTPKHGDLFAHMSTKRPGYIAFTDCAEKGVSDTQTVIAPGRFLKRYFDGVLDDQAIETWANKCILAGGHIGYKITQDADEIERVYTKGPRSCMSYTNNHYSSHVHPSRVYAGPDLAVAYLGTLDEVTARCVIWPDRKRRSVTYGDTHKLNALLERDGFSRIEFEGARVRRIEQDDGFVMPYVDDIGYAEDDGEYIVLGSGGIHVQTTNGVTCDNRVTCDSCGDRVDEDDIYSVDEERWCEGCAEETWICEYSDTRFPEGDDNRIEVHGTNSWRDCVTVHRRYLSRFGAVLVESRDEYWAETRTFACRVCDEYHVDEDRSATFGEADICEGCGDNMSEADEAAMVATLEAERLAAIAAAKEAAFQLEMGRLCRTLGMWTRYVEGYGTPYAATFSDYDRSCYRTPPRALFGLPELADAE